MHLNYHYIPVLYIVKYETKNNVRSKCSEQSVSTDVKSYLSILSAEVFCPITTLKCSKQNGISHNSTENCVSELLVNERKRASIFCNSQKSNINFDQILVKYGE